MSTHIPGFWEKSVLLVAAVGGGLVGFYAGDRFFKRETIVLRYRKAIFLLVLVLYGAVILALPLDSRCSEIVAAMVFMFIMSFFSSTPPKQARKD
jgi:ABC-type lipoprotein release transport system permease subunit